MQRSFLLSFSLLSFSALGAPKSDLWPYWQQSSSDSSQVISHQLWQQVIKDNLKISGSNTLFDYQHISSQDQKRLQRYIQQQTSLNPFTYNSNEQLAYWINLYNALTVNLVIENYPVESITDIGGWFRFGPWDQEITSINGKPLTLNDIEHRILRPIWKDARIHYAVNCASLGCPNLQPDVFTGSQVKEQLEDAAQEFIQSRKGVRLEGNTLILSSIYDWYSEDFGNQKQLLQHLIRYRPDLNNFQGSTDYQYDWGLNKTTD